MAFYYLKECKVNTVEFHTMRFKIMCFVMFFLMLLSCIPNVEPATLKKLIVKQSI